MFTGIIQKTGKMVSLTRNVLNVQVPSLSAKRGESVAVNGACLTVTGSKRKDGPTLFSFDLSEETLKKTTLGWLKSGTLVNIEKALAAQDALGGHILQGHVDGVGEVAKVTPKGDGKVLWFRAPAGFMEYVVAKGSAGVDGVSLTVAEVSGNQFAVSLIPYTLRHTTLSRLKKGDSVNLEADIIAKYVKKYIHLYT